jgi:hypothetical protein
MCSESQVTRMQPRSKVELFAAIRRDAGIEKLSIHELSRRTAFIGGWFGRR